MKIFRSITIGVALCTPFAAQSDALPIHSGLWEITTTMNNPFTGAQTRTQQECVKEDTFDPESLMKDAQDCRLNQSELKGDTLTFSMNCNMEGMQGSVSGRFQADGDSAEGHMNISFSVSGQTMEMQNEWRGKRLGDC